MKSSSFDYDLPPGAIAQRPVEPRHEARLLAHEVEADRTRHLLVRDLPGLLAPGDLLVVNDTRVRRARLVGRRASGGAIEVLLLAPLDEACSRWRALVRPAARLRSGEAVELEGGRLVATMEERAGAEDGSGGAWTLALEREDDRGASIEEAIERAGRMPLPPYVERPGGEDPDPDREDDARWYQTAFARELGAVAAPTAGLHFTEELLENVEQRGVGVAALTLHVGEGTFRPVRAELVAEHRMHTERYDLPEETAHRIATCRAEGGRVVAVGTTVLRVLETLTDEQGLTRPGTGETSLFLKPGDPIRSVDALLTNFHLPRSTLLMLVAAVAGLSRVLRLYREAIEQGYRFYSYGDAMLLLRESSLRG